MNEYDVWLSAPSLTDGERELLLNAFDSGWISPYGYFTTRFEQLLSQQHNGAEVCIVNSGTAALHLALLALGIGPCDRVVVASHTFIASVNPIRYVGATPVLCDSDPHNVHISFEHYEDYLSCSTAKGYPPKAIIVPHLYGQIANIESIVAVSKEYGIFVIEDAAESLGAKLNNQPVGTFGDISILSFNGNKLVTTSSGGALLSADARLVANARHLASQARVNAAHYEHNAVGYNYRMSNLLAALGVGQLERIDSIVHQKRLIWQAYYDRLKSLRQLTFEVEPSDHYFSRWLTTASVQEGGTALRDNIITVLKQNRIEARPFWKPIHLQGPYTEADFIGDRINSYAERLFLKGLCLPSSISLQTQQIERICDIIEECVAQFLE